ncbi:MAG: hypothetical protein R2764_06685 [Bacteroidales bacterium]
MEFGITGIQMEIHNMKAIGKAISKQDYGKVGMKMDKYIRKLNGRMVFRMEGNQVL